MDLLKELFERKKAVHSALTAFGFVYENGSYVYEKTLSVSEFLLRIQVSDHDEVTAEIIDPSFNEPYTLHLDEANQGSFVGEVRKQYIDMLTKIAEQCFETDVFKSSQTKALIDYVRSRYGDEPEYLWEKFPDNAIWRRADNRKWYGVLLTVSKQKLGLASKEVVEIIDLRLQPEQMENLIDHQRYFPGWHMNKRSWYTMILDGSVSMEEIKRRIDESFELAAERRK